MQKSLGITALHDCIDTKGRRLGIVLAKRYEAGMQTAWSRMAKETAMGTAATRLLTHAPSLPFLTNPASCSSSFPKALSSHPNLRADGRIKHEYHILATERGKRSSIQFTRQ